jgi:hypothetical protein
MPTTHWYLGLNAIDDGKVIKIANSTHIRTMMVEMVALMRIWLDIVNG